MRSVGLQEIELRRIDVGHVRHEDADLLAHGAGKRRVGVLTRNSRGEGHGRSARGDRGRGVGRHVVRGEAEGSSWRRRSGRSRTCIVPATGSTVVSRNPPAGPTGVEAENGEVGLQERDRAAEVRGEDAHADPLVLAPLKVKCLRWPGTVVVPVAGDPRVSAAECRQERRSRSASRSPWPCLRIEHELGGRSGSA